jgi:hypothetical protein
MKRCTAFFALYLTLVTIILAAAPPKIITIESGFQQGQVLPRLEIQQGANERLQFKLQSAGAWLDINGLTGRWEARSTPTSTNALLALSTVTSNLAHYIEVPLNSVQTGTSCTNWVWSFIAVDTNGFRYPLGTGTLNVIASDWAGPASSYYSQTNVNALQAQVTALQSNKQNRATNAPGAASWVFHAGDTNATAPYWAPDSSLVGSDYLAASNMCWATSLDGQVIVQSTDLSTALAAVTSTAQVVYFRGNHTIVKSGFATTPACRLLGFGRTASVLTFSGTWWAGGAETIVLENLTLLHTNLVTDYFYRPGGGGGTLHLRNALWKHLGATGLSGMVAGGHLVVESSTIENDAASFLSGVLTCKSYRSILPVSPGAYSMVGFATNELQEIPPLPYSIISDPPDLSGYYPRSNPSNYITLAEVPAFPTPTVGQVISAGGDAVNGSVSNLFSLRLSGGSRIWNSSPGMWSWTDGRYANAIRIQDDIRRLYGTNGTSVDAYWGDGWLGTAHTATGGQQVVNYQTMIGKGYLTSESDTLDTVLGRGNVSALPASFGSLSAMQLVVNTNGAGSISHGAYGSAKGSWSFSGGYRAYASNDYAFVWGGSTTGVGSHGNGSFSIFTSAFGSGGIWWDDVMVWRTNTFLLPVPAGNITGAPWLTSSSPLDRNNVTNFNDSLYAPSNIVVTLGTGLVTRANGNTCVLVMTNNTEIDFLTSDWPTNSIGRVSVDLIPAGFSVSASTNVSGFGSLVLTNVVNPLFFRKHYNLNTWEVRQ